MKAKPKVTCELKKLKKLYRKYPYLKEVSFECGYGWIDLIGELCAELKATKVKFVLQQLKEKFGELRFYFSVQGNCSDEEYRKFDNIVDKYTLKSLQTCDICGEEGWLTVERGWLATRCEEHMGPNAQRFK